MKHKDFQERGAEFLSQRGGLGIVVDKEVHKEFSEGWVGIPVELDGIKRQKYLEDEGGYTEIHMHINMFS